MIILCLQKIGDSTNCFLLFYFWYYKNILVCKDFKLVIKKIVVGKFMLFFKLFFNNQFSINLEDWLNSKFM